MTEAFRLIFSGDAETWGIIARSLGFSFAATLFSLVPGIPLGIWLSWKATPRRKTIASLVHATSALPTVVIGLFAYSLLSRSGPLGNFGFLYAPPGVIFGQCLLATPLVASVTYAGLSRIDPRFRETLATFGAPAGLRFAETVREGRTGILAALVLSFGRVTGEVGVSMMLGGNIKGYTRTMTTAIALDAAKGEFERAISLGLVLLAIAIAVNLAVNRLDTHAA